MKKKIPFGATIAHAYQFAFSNFFQIALLIWVSFLVSLILGAFAMSQINQLITAVQARDPSAWTHVGPLIPLYLAGLILLGVQFTAVSEYALGMRRPSLFNFPLGKPVWRVMGAFVLAFLAILLTAIGLGMIALALGAMLGLLVGGLMSSDAVAVWTGLFAGLGMLFIEGAIFYGAFRLFFLLTPVTLVSRQVDLYESWRLTKGNFWRIFGICIAILIPLAIIEYALIFAAIGLPDIPPGASQETQLQAQMNWNIAMFEAVLKYWYICLAFAAVAAPILYGLMAGAQTFAYRALTEGLSVPVASDGLPDS